MEEVARLDDAPLVPGRGFTISPAIDANLRDRIRSLLISRNRQRPPRTPCPSPDYSYLPHSPEEASSAISPIYTRTYRFSPAEAIAKLIRLEYEASDMGATRFDGPAGQIQKDDGDIQSRRPSQPNMEEDRNQREGWAWPRLTSGLNQRAQQDTLGREPLITNTPNRSKPAPRKSPGSRLPNSYLRTVPPATDVNRTLRPSPLHVPGSYQSEVDVKADPKSKFTSPILEETLETMGSDVLAVPTYVGLHDEHGHNAIDALYELKEHDYHPAGPAKDLHSPHMAAIARNLATTLVDDEGPNDDALDAPVYVIGSDHEEQNTQDVETDPASAGIQTNAAQLRQEQRNAVEDVLNDYTIAKHVVGRDKAPSSTHPPSARSLQSVPFEAGPITDSAESPLLPKSSTSPAPVAPVDDKSTSVNVEISSSPEKSQKPSPVNRAMSMLSEISARSGLQASSLRSIKQHKRSASTNLTARPSHHRNRAAQNSSYQRVRRTLAEGGYRPLRRGPPSQHFQGMETSNETIVLRQQENQSESFTKAINDLESLLKEALNIAGHAASREHSEDIPLSPQDRQKGYGHIGLRESIDSSECVSSFSGGADEEDNYTTLPSRHTGDHQGNVSIDEISSNAHHQGRFAKGRDAKPYPAQKQHLSTIPNLYEDLPKPKPDGTHREFFELPRTSSRTGALTQKSLYHQRFNPTDWAVIRVPAKLSRVRLEMAPTPPTPQPPPTVKVPTKEQHAFLQRAHRASESALTRDSIREYVNAHQRPPIEPRISSIRLRKAKPKLENFQSRTVQPSDEESGCTCVPYVADFKTAGLQYHPVYQEAIAGEPPRIPSHRPHPIQPRQDTLASLNDPEKHDRHQHREKSDQKEIGANKDYTLKDRHHFSIREPRGFSLSRSHRRSPIARDWSTSRKRFVAIVTCITTAFVGLIIGIYAGEVPAIQYAIADEHHYTILGNVLFFLGLATTTALFYPLPLLHGRKPYTVAALAILLPLQFPQALAINSNRSPYVATYRIGLLLPRIFAGIVMGFANINFVTTLLDLFGASLQSGNPHQETVNVNDVRRHGGGMGVWLGIYTFSSIGSIGIGFLIGAGIISGLDVSWGYWITIILNAAVLVLNVLTPEVRRSAYRRSMAEVRTGTDVSRRVARGEIKMHLESTGPIWWWEEVVAGHVLAIRMLKQPGFVVLACYLGWIYGQVVLVIVVSSQRPTFTREAHTCVATWSTAVQVLSIPSSVCWTGCRNHPPRRSIRNTLSEGVIVQPGKTSSSKNGQHDLRKARYLDISPC